MSPDKQQRLYDRFDFFAQGKHLVDRAIACGDGWFEIIQELCKGLEAALDRGRAKGEIQSDRENPFVVEQVKEKFGGLRFYVSWETKEIGGLIREAESKSFKTCEACGQPGRPRNGGWVLTLCDTCAQ